MLRQLLIQNFAIVQNLDVDFHPGLTIFTGETGAGKSIIIDALGLVLGDRAQNSVVRAGCDRALITAYFDISNNSDVHDFLEQLGILHEDDECMIRRQIESDGRSRAFINNTPVTTQTLREIGELLVDIHGQHAHHSLLKRETQLQLLDDASQSDQLLTQTRNAYTEWRKLNKALDDLTATLAHKTAEDLDFLQFQIQELEMLAFNPEEHDALELEHKRLAHLETLIGACQRTLDLVTNEQGATTLLNKAYKEIQNACEFDPKLTTVAQLIDNSIINLDEAISELQDYSEQQNLEPDRLQEVENRISVVHRIARKHRISIAEIPQHLTELKQRVAFSEEGADRLADLQKQLSTSLAMYLQSAEKLHVWRLEYAEVLAKNIADVIHQLGMPGGKFSIQINPDRTKPPSPTGYNQIEFLVSANPGQPLQTLGKVASGGELSRISLAIQVLAAQEKGVPTLVFDEVDVGIGGAVAEIVGQQLRKLGQKKQVLCVTHQAQVAALGHHHYKVVKHTKNNETFTEVKVLVDEDKTMEIARMLGGIKITTQTIEHARTLLCIEELS